MSDNITIETETWVETQPQEVVGYGWNCVLCDTEQHHMYSYDSVEQATTQHLREEHSIREDSLR